MRVAPRAPSLRELLAGLRSARVGWYNSLGWPFISFFRDGLGRVRRITESLHGSRTHELRPSIARQEEGSVLEIGMFIYARSLWAG